MTTKEVRPRSAMSLLYTNTIREPMKEQPNSYVLKKTKDVTDTSL
jgi:hypothetical protein